MAPKIRKMKRLVEGSVIYHQIGIFLPNCPKAETISAAVMDFYHIQYIKVNFALSPEKNNIGEMENIQFYGGFAIRSQISTK